MLGLLLATSIGAQLAPTADGDPLFNTSMVQDPGEGETAGEGETLVFHEGLGGPPAQGYFMEHEPGEVAEFHLFVPDQLDPKRRYPLLIVFHGGKDGASGRGMLRGMSKISTKEHPVIVLSPNMYTMDAYFELQKEGELPIDPRRVVVFGFSSGGMGVLAAMREYSRSDGAFEPATLICASTTAAMGRANYPQVPYVVMAGERETPEFVKNGVLENRRSTCRQHSLAMQKVIREIRYLEMQGYGHTAGKPEHHAVIRNLIRALPEPHVKLKLSKTPAGLQPLVDAARLADWAEVRREIARLDASEEWATKNSYKTLRGRVLKALERSFKGDLEFIIGVGPESPTWELLRAFQLFDRLETIPPLFTGTPLAAKLSKLFGSLRKSRRWQAELDARRRYFEIVSEPPSEEMAAQLETLRQQAPETEFGGNRTREKLLALRG